MTTAPEFQLALIEDDRLIHEGLRLILPKNWKMVGFMSPPSFPLREMFHAAFVDMHYTQHSKKALGPSIIESLFQSQPNIQIIGISGDLSLDLMEDCLNHGASKFLAKPLMPAEVLSSLEKIEALWRLRETSTRAGAQPLKWVGSGPASDQVKQRLASLRGESGPILIEGETGTGKEVAFRLLNQQEPHRPLITVNIASIPENLFESELFGHVKGAFTGADTLKIGLTEAAHGGDLFLDEIEALPLGQQVKLLRFLETGEVRKVGAKDSVHVKARVIIASNQKLTSLVASGLFREDLYYRISGKKIELPPLRDRTEDIEELANFFLSLQKPRVNKKFSDEAIRALRTYSWPGNTRELKRVSEQLVLISPLPIIRREDVERLLKSDSPMSSSLPLDFSIGLSALVESFESDAIKKCLAQLRDIDQVAQTLKISRSSLYKKIKDYQIEVPQ